MKGKTSLYLMFALFGFYLCLNGVKAADYTNYFGIEMTNKQYNNLLNQGFQENEIYYMNEEVFNENKDLNASLEAVTTKFYKTIYTDLNGKMQTVELTELEYENESSNQTRGFVETSYKRMDAYISKIDNTHFRYKVTVGWKQMPSVRSYDIIGLAFEGLQVTISSLVKFQFNYCISNGTCYADGTFYDKQENYNGGSAVYKFPSNAISMTATLYYDVIKNTTATITNQQIHGDYAHATSNVTSSIYRSHTMTNGGLSFSTAAVQYYDEIPCADTGWTGSW